MGTGYVFTFIYEIMVLNPSREGIMMDVVYAEYIIKFVSLCESGAGMSVNC